MAASSAATFLGSPRAMLSGMPAGTHRAISRSTRPLTAPSEPGRGFLGIHDVRPARDGSRDLSPPTARSPTAASALPCEMLRP